MAKIKARIRDEKLFIRVRVALSEVISEDDLTKFSHLNMKGFFKPQTVKKHSVDYFGAVGISLRERLEYEISDYDFFFIIEQIVDATRNLQKNSTPWDRVLWNLDSVFINETTKELRFIYLPLDGVRKKSNLMEFIDSIIYSAHPKDSESHCISDFVYFLHGLKGYDFNRIEAYITEINRRIVNTVKGNTSGKSGFITDKPREYYDHYERKQDKGTDILVEDSETGYQDEATGLLTDEYDISRHNENSRNQNNSEDDGTTGLLYEDADTEENDALGEQTGILEELPGYPTLFRTRTQETISINKPVFRFGKERSYVDYFVSNNNAVSRSHADIIVRGKKTFIKDLNSTNKTYINEMPITANCETEIFDNDRIRLGNEEFVFHA